MNAPLNLLDSASHMALIEFNTYVKSDTSEDVYVDYLFEAIPSLPKGSHKSVLEKLVSGDYLFCGDDGTLISSGVFYRMTEKGLRYYNTYGHL